ncbi:MAG: UDP-N-acetylmuramate--L-alanine ligase [Clostridia bacterium]|nr:UDP-N-acetylmuramate--L-alanine ligase [Clostridia bacterium]
MSVNNTHLGVYEINEKLSKCKSVFFIGAGGINMSSLAIITKQRGFKVGGSDRTKTALTERLEACGIEMYYEHNAENLNGYDAVVYTVAISPNNPEYVRAINDGLLCISRADYLGFVMTGYRERIGVCGMHGKSSCTSMCAQVFMDAEADPTVLSGAELDSMGGAFRIGGEDHFIFEACEYMDSFLDFNPTVAIVLNIEMDHVDYFHSIEQIRNSFSSFVSITGENGYTVANADDENVTLALDSYKGNVITFGVSSNADFTAKNIKYIKGRPDFDVYHNNEFYCHISLSVTGEHNVYNALATVAAAQLCGISATDISKGLANYCGAKRRMELKGTIRGAVVYDDYGHHPTEVKTTLDGVKRMGYDRLCCVFHSHTYSRTAELFDEFASAFCSVDKVIVSDIYAARETDTLGMSGPVLASAIGERAVYLGDLDNIAEYLNENMHSGDVLVVMGAGDIYKLFDKLNFDKEEDNK